MSFTKNDQAVVLNRESLQYLANCIRLVHSLPDLLNDVLPSQTTTYSSYKVTELLNTLNTDLQNYVNNALGNLSHLKKAIVSVAPTDSSADEDTIYLVQDASGGYEQYLKINGVVTSLGSTSAINNVYTKTESDSKFGLLSTLNSLITVVGGLNDLTTTDKTSIVNAINELKTSVTALENKSTMVTLTQAEYNQLVADGTIDNDTYYIISDDSENIEITQTISSSSTKNEVPSALSVFNLLQAVYPVGSVYINTTDVNPSTIFGFGTWERVAQNMTLWGSSADGEVGTTKSAGLPNITGRIGYFSGDRVLKGNGMGELGAFDKYNTINSSINNVSISGTADSYYFDFDASLSNSIYGNSTTVQPPALVINIWKRTA